MPVLDWVFVGVLGLSCALGAWRGLAYEILSLVSWLAAFVLAQWFAPAAAALLPMSGAAPVLRYAAAYVLIFVATVMLGALVGVVIKKLFAAAGLRPADRALGALFGLARGTVVLLAATVLVSMTALKTSDWWLQSAGAGIASTVLHGLKPVLPEEFGKYLP